MDRKEAFTQMKSWIPGHERFPLQTIVKMLIEIIAELEPDHLNDFYVPPEPTPEPMPANSKKRSQTQLSRTYIDGDDDTTAFDDSLLNSSHVSTNSQRRRYPQTADTSPVDENMAQQVQLLKQA